MHGDPPVFAYSTVALGVQRAPTQLRELCEFAPELIVRKDFDVELAIVVALIAVAVIPQLSLGFGSLR